MMARARATSLRENSGVTSCGILAFKTQNRLLILPDGNELHLGRDDALARVMHLRDAAPPPRLALEIKTQFGQLRIGQPLAAVLRGRAFQDFGIASLGNPTIS